MSSHNEFSYFVEICENIRSTTSKNLKVSILSEYLSRLDNDSLPIAILFLSGRIFPRGSRQNINVGFSIIMQSLSEIAMLDASEIQQVYLTHGDMGALSEYAVSKKHIFSLFRQQQQQTLCFVYNQLKKIADTVGSGASKNKSKILTGLLIDMSPQEAKYLIKIINGEMRIGLVEGLIEIAIAKAFNQNIKVIREAMLVAGDIAQVSILAKRNLLDKAIIKPLTPLSFMLADVMFTAEEIINYYEKPLICEYKYDGIRVQMHKFGQEIRMFSRKLADVTNAFPELVDAALGAIVTSSSSSSSSPSSNID